MSAHNPMELTHQSAVDSTVSYRLKQGQTLDGQH